MVAHDVEFLVFLGVKDAPAPIVETVCAPPRPTPALRPVAAQSTHPSGYS